MSFSDRENEWHDKDKSGEFRSTEKPSKQTLDGIWGNESGKMLVICNTDETGVEFSIGLVPGNIQAFVTLAPYRVKRLIEVLQKTLENKPVSDVKG